MQLRIVQQSLFYLSDRFPLFLQKKYAMMKAPEETDLLIRGY